ncbi:Hypothetical predicted protein [Paramuricea clavata]|uniref:Uncharacterized protein n=1 Tax=Paramuricea clavata TaxID=317549 RepID=A0A6S7FEH3_PARCT|nr:Hypothetical predicted protein [Paramuricea clavata]
MEDGKTIVTYREKSSKVNQGRLKRRKITPNEVKHIEDGNDPKSFTFVFNFYMSKCLESLREYQTLDIDDTKRVSEALSSCSSADTCVINETSVESKVVHESNLDWVEQFNEESDLCDVILSQALDVYESNSRSEPSYNNTLNGLFCNANIGTAQLWLLQRKMMTINTLDEDIITSIVPSFPILDITFRRGIAMIKGDNQHVLFNAEDAVRLAAQEKIVGTKWCHITIEETNYLVVWKFEILTGEPTVANQDQATAGDENTKHTLPFKVLGVSYKNRQIHLKCVSEKLKRNEEVQIMIKPEPDNDHDKCNCCASNLWNLLENSWLYCK